MNETMLIEEGIFGPRLILTSAWDPAFAAYMKEHRIYGLVANYARGWTDKHIAFLRDLPFLTEFVIVNWTIDDVSPMHVLKNVRALQVSTYCNTPLHFEAFPQLEDCGLTWRKGSESLFGCRTLRRLFLSDYTGQDSAVFSGLDKVEDLSLSGGALKNVTGLRALTRLRSLGLYHLKKLVGIEGLEALEQLQELEIVDCPGVARIDSLHALLNLRKLVLANLGAVDSLTLLANLKKLEWLTFPGSTNVVDGDLSPVLRLPNLRTVAFQNRRHYSHKREDISALLRD